MFVFCAKRTSIGISSAETHFVLGLYSSSSSSKSLTRAWKWYQLREWALYVFFRIWLTPCSLLAQWVARKLSKWTCADSDILCRAPVFFLSPEKIRFRHLQSSANISNPQTKICSLIARKTYTRKVNITAIPKPMKPMKNVTFLLKPTFKEFRSWRISFNSISVNLKEKHALTKKNSSSNSASTLVCLGRPTRTPLSLSCQAQRWHICIKEMLILNSEKCFFLIRRNVFSCLDKYTYSARSWFSLAARPSLFARSDVSRCWSCSVTWK